MPLIPPMVEQSGLAYIGLLRKIIQYLLADFLDTIMTVGKFIKRLVGSAILCLTIPATAWDGVNAGNIAAFEIDNGANFAFRVLLTGAPIMCTGGPGWAFLNETDSNYKVYVSALLAAKAAGDQVTIWATTSGGYCRIGHMKVGP